MTSSRPGDKRRFTLDTYAHVMPGMQAEAAERFMEMVYDDEQDIERGWESSR